MSLSKQTQENIHKFAREEAGKHLSNAEISYFERLGRKSEQTKDKILKKMSKFKPTSQQTLDAVDDLTLYMNDYMTDLIEQGNTEDEALELAKAALKADSNSNQAADIRDKYLEYYLSKDPALEETIGLYYGGFTILGMVLGAVIGLLLGLLVFTEYFWITVIISTVAGILIGTACAMLKNAELEGKNK